MRLLLPCSDGYQTACRTVGFLRGFFIGMALYVGYFGPPGILSLGIGGGACFILAADGFLGDAGTSTNDEV